MASADGASSFEDRAPSWEALAAAVHDAQSEAERERESSLYGAARGSSGAPSAKASLRLFGAPPGTEPRVTLYRDSAAWCPYCQKVWMQLEEKQIPFKVEKINMRCYGDKPAWFERATGGLLPVLELDGKLVTDSVSIMLALERAFPEQKPLLPDAALDAPRHAAVASLKALEQTHASAWLGYLRSGGDGGKAKYEHCLDRMDAALGDFGGPYFLGTDLSLVDLLFVSFAERAVASLLYYKGFEVRDVTRWPRVCAWFDALETRPSYLASVSDYYTHAMDLPPQLGGCASNGSPAAAQAKASIDGGDWTWPLPTNPPQPLPHWATTPAGSLSARVEAAQQLVRNHAAVVKFATRAHGPPGAPPVMANYSASLWRVSRDWCLGFMARTMK